MNRGKLLNRLYFYYNFILNYNIGSKSKIHFNFIINDRNTMLSTIVNFSFS